MLASGAIGLVSVVIPTHGRPREVTRAVMSVASQSYRPVEILVTDDGSEPPIKLPTWCGEQQQGVPIKVIRHSSTKGAQAARNTGIRAASGEWIAFLDSDDYWFPDKLESQVRVLLRAQSASGLMPAGIVSNGHSTRDGKSRQRMVRRNVPQRACTEILRGGVALFQTLLVRKSSLIEIGLLDINIVSFQEWDSAIRLCNVGEIVFDDNEVFVWDQSGGPTISGSAERDTTGYLQVIFKHGQAFCNAFGRKEYLRAIIWNLTRRQQELTLRYRLRLACASLIGAVAVFFRTETGLPKHLLLRALRIDDVP